MTTGCPELVMVSLYNVIALGVRTLQAELIRRGHRVTTIFFQYQKPRSGLQLGNFDRALDPLLDALRRLDPPLIGVGVFTYLVPAATLLTQRIQTELGKPVIWGGIHAALYPERSLEHADLVCIGDGEVALPPLLAAMQRGRDPVSAARGLPNLVTRADRGRSRERTRTRLEDLDTVAPPQFLDPGFLYLKGDRIHETWPYPRDAFLSTLHTSTSRGCPFRCTYCASHLEHRLYPGLPPVRRRSVENVIDELRLARQHNPSLKRVFFWDDVFLLNPKWLTEFAERYRREIGLPFFAYAHPNTLTPRVLDLAVSAGMDEITVGIQAGPSLSRSLFDRPYNPEQLVAGAHHMRTMGLTPAYDVIQGNPMATAADQRELLELVMRLPRPFELNTHDLQLFPGYRITEVAEQRGMGPSSSSVVAPESRYVWDGALAPTRPPAQLAWDALLYLAARGAPPTLLRRLSRSAIYQRIPYPVSVPLFVWDRGLATVRSLFEV